MRTHSDGVVAAKPLEMNAFSANVGDVNALDDRVVGVLNVESLETVLQGDTNHADICRVVNTENNGAFAGAASINDGRPRAAQGDWCLGSSPLALKADKMVVATSDPRIIFTRCHDD